MLHSQVFLPLRASHLPSNALHANVTPDPPYKADILLSHRIMCVHCLASEQLGHTSAAW
jgi:hypothetical protein